MIKDLTNLASELTSLPSQVELIIHSRENDAFSRALEEFARDLSEVSAGRITLSRDKGEHRLPGLPAFTLSCEKRNNIHYLAIPEGHELPPFLHALQYICRGNAPVSAEVGERLDEVSSPADIWVLVSPHCTNCPKVVKSVVAMASMNSLLSVTIVDVQYFNELAEAHAVKSVPATIIDGQLVLIGQVAPERLLWLLARRGTEEYTRELMRSLIDRGRASEAAQRLARGEGGEALVSLFQEEELSTRMGVLVVLEGALEKDRSAVKKMVPSLIRLLSHEDSRIRGDMADFLGRVGDLRAVPHLERLTSDPDPDVVEAAADALEEMRV